MRNQMKKVLCLAGFLVVLLWGHAVPAGVIGPELQPALPAMNADEEIPVIVTFSDRVDLTPFKGRGNGRLRARLVRALRVKAEETQKPVKELLKGRGVKWMVSLWAINGLALSAPPGVILELAGLPGVESVRLDSTLNQPVETLGLPSTPEWNVEMIRAPELWARGYTGTGVVVASMDTGVDPNHPDLAGKWAGKWFDPNGEHAIPYDSAGHGTQVMGLMVGGNAGGTAIGVAPDATWAAVKIFNDDGYALLSGIHQGFQWLLDPDGDPVTDDAPGVVNNSWGFPYLAGKCYTEFQQDIEILKTAGIAVIFSAGNQGPAGFTSESPANNPGGIAVGAVDDFREIAIFSSRGPSACDGSFYPEVSAPGVNVRTSDLTIGGIFPDSYVFVTGTSFSSPHVAGGMALLLSAYSGATVDELEQALKETAVDLGTFGPDNDYGYGLIDLMEAYNILPNLPPPLCTDNDGDGYYAEEACGKPVDCDDYDFNINPGACDIKRDGIDQDCDGRDRLSGKPCPSNHDDNGDITAREGKGKTCSDGLDNDGDDLIDCGDEDCSSNKSCF